MWQKSNPTYLGDVILFATDEHDEIPRVAHQLPEATCSRIDHGYFMSHATRCFDSSVLMYGGAEVFSGCAICAVSPGD